MGEVEWERTSRKGPVGKAKWERSSGKGCVGRPSGRGRVGGTEWEKSSGRERLSGHVSGTLSMAHTFSVGPFGTYIVK